MDSGNAVFKSIDGGGSSSTGTGSVTTGSLLIRWASKSLVSKEISGGKLVTRGSECGDVVRCWCVVVVKSSVGSDSLSGDCTIFNAFILFGLVILM